MTSNYDIFDKEELTEMLNIAESARLNNFVAIAKQLVMLDCRGIECEDCPFYDEDERNCMCQSYVWQRLEKLGYLKQE